MDNDAFDERWPGHWRRARALIQLAALGRGVAHVLDPQLQRRPLEDSGQAIPPEFSSTEELVDRLGWWQQQEMGVDGAEEVKRRLQGSQLSMSIRVFAIRDCGDGVYDLLTTRPSCDSEVGSGSFMLFVGAVRSGSSSRPAADVETADKERTKQAEADVQATEAAIKDLLDPKSKGDKHRRAQQGPAQPLSQLHAGMVISSTDCGKRKRFTVRIGTSEASARGAAMETTPNFSQLCAHDAPRVLLPDGFLLPLGHRLPSLVSGVRVMESLEWLRLDGQRREPQAAQWTQLLMGGCAGQAGSNDNRVVGVEAAAGGSSSAGSNGVGAEWVREQVQQHLPRTATLNSGQRAVLEAGERLLVEEANPKPAMLVQGPPGTGKTHTTAQLARDLLESLLDRYFIELLEPEVKLLAESVDPNQLDSYAYIVDVVARLLQLIRMRPRALLTAASNAAVTELQERLTGLFQSRFGHQVTFRCLRIASEGSCNAPGLSSAVMCAASRNIKQSYASDMEEARQARLQAEAQANATSATAAAAGSAATEGGRAQQRAQQGTRGELQAQQRGSARARSVAAGQRLQVQDARQSLEEGAAIADECYAEIGKALQNAQAACKLGKLDGPLVEAVVHAARHAVDADADMVMRQLTAEILMDPAVDSPDNQALMEEQLITMSDVVFATLSMCVPAPFSTAARAIGFRLLIVDEAAQATIPQLLQALTLGCQKAFLVGDHKQLPATIKLRAACDAHLDRSLFEVLLEQVTLLRLNEQYRMHPHIADFPSRYFYGGALADAAAVLRRPDPAWLRDATGGAHRVVLDAIDGRERQEETSKVNEVEVRLVLGLVRLLARVRCPLSNIGIIAPYTGQCEAVKAALMKEAGGLLREAGKVKVASVDGFQGGEKEVIIVSCVRASAQPRSAAAAACSSGVVPDAADVTAEFIHDFVSDPRRANVALTRPRTLLVVVGQREELSKRDVWRAYFEDAKVCNCLLRVNRDVLPDLGESLGGAKKGKVAS